MRRACTVLLALCVTVQTPGAFGTQTGDDRAVGIRQVEGGEFDAAILTLDAAARRLAAEGGRPKDLARAYTYLAIAYLGLSQEQAAKAKFLEALKTDSTLDLSPRDFPPKIIEFFERARSEALAAQPKPSPRPAEVRPSPPPPPAATGPQVPPAAEKKGGSKALPILLGLGAAAGIGVAVSGGGGGDSPGPTATTPPTAAPAIPPIFVELRLNGQRSGQFTCSGPLSFTITVGNRGTQAARANTFAMSLSTTSTGCVTHAAPVDGSAIPNRDIPAGTGVEIRRFDLAGDLCRAPQRPGCSWRANIQVNTNAGSAEDSMEFSTRN